ncbi:MAG: hypothetical protein QG656_2662, partial [Candidatus Hydrogenedentes bacterium]|nr:hypothetical protein [Candidatus Hydrogenedentota bacterium]
MGHGGIVLAHGLITLACLTAAASVEEQVSLAGTWRFRVDAADAGIREEWFRQNLPDEVRLPGAMAEGGYGDGVTADTRWTGTVVNRMWHEEDRFAKYRDPGNTKIMFWLQPDKYYVGPAWYQRDVDIPESFRGKRVTLLLERCHWETQVWVDDTAAGSQNSLTTPHEYDLSAALTPGPHRLTIRVDNTVKIAVGPDAHSVSDNTQGNWNGITGTIALIARDPVWMNDIQVYPNLVNNTAKVCVKISNQTGVPAVGTLTLAARSWNGAVEHAPAPLEVPVDASAATAEVTAEYPLGDGAQYWSEFAPNLYELTATLDTDAAGGSHKDTKSVNFGMREFAANGTRFTLNGSPIFLRGTLECCIFPLTGYPPADLESWLRVLNVAKAHGLNHIRFHSWCPPEAAFDAADKLGVIF